MDNLNVDELKPLLNYFPIKIGKTSLYFDNKKNSYFLKEGNLQWMSLNFNDFGEIKDQFIELSLAEGKIVTTGLGLGCRETILAQKHSVKEIIVYEKNKDVIEMFDLFAKQSNFNTNKIKVVHGDAIDALKIDCDWLLLDHFEIAHQTYWEVIDEVRFFSKNCAANKLFFWPFMVLYKTFCLKKKLDIASEKSYSVFTQKLNADKMPDSIDSELLQHASKINI